MKEHKGWHERGYLPHFDSPETVQMLTVRQGDALPVEVMAAWRREIEETPDALALKKRELQRRAERFLDAGHGSCILRQDWAAQLVLNALWHFDGVRYRLLRFVIMPNHVHLLLEQKPEFLLGEAIGRWKGFTGREINKVLEKRGSFWQEDYFDRFVRGEDHLERARFYIENNPVKAGLCARPEDWPWSSAFSALPSE